MRSLSNLSQQDTEVEVLLAKDNGGLRSRRLRSGSNATMELDSSSAAGRASQSRWARLPETTRNAIVFFICLGLHFCMFPLSIGSDLTDFTEPADAAKVLINFPDGGAVARGRVMAVLVLTVTLWLFQPIPTHIAAFVPLVSFPFLGIGSGGDLSKLFFKDTAVLITATSFIGNAIIRVNLHKRVALFILSRTGTRPQMLLAGFYGVSAFLSMWISNTAAVVMLCPIALDTLKVLEIQLKQTGTTGAEVRRLKVALVMGVGYAANIGGMGTYVVDFADC
jgi:di/tricarboxylate transporter